MFGVFVGAAGGRDFASVAPAGLFGSEGGLDWRRLSGSSDITGCELSQLPCRPPYVFVSQCQRWCGGCKNLVSVCCAAWVARQRAVCCSVGLAFGFWAFWVWTVFWAAGLVVVVWAVGSYVRQHVYKPTAVLGRCLSSNFEKQPRLTPCCLLLQSRATSNVWAAWPGHGSAIAATLDCLLFWLGVLGFGGPAAHAVWVGRVCALDSKAMLQRIQSRSCVGGCLRLAGVGVGATASLYSCVFKTLVFYHLQSSRVSHAALAAV